ncbi:MAG TPA: tripartite tricarboxylate transporter substrate binding protein [Xanthobacteraceae bacterium]|nr:tripartite tricarboxylate transporter substrate binding protein [Xanthobacteraceae bacterium]
MCFSKAFAISFAVVSLALTAPCANAQTPSRTIRIVAPYTPGSGPDILSRLMAEQIGRNLGPQVVVENRPGGGTLIGTEMVARAEPDGNTVLLAGSSFAVNPALKRGSEDLLASFAPVCYLASTPMVMVVKTDSPYQTLDDLLKAAREKPGQLSLASGGPGSSLHVSFEVVKRAAKVDMTYVPFGGTAPSINALMGGHVTTVFADYPTVVSQLKSGTLRGLVTTSPQRSPAMPDVPTLRETGLSNYDAEIFYGIVAPVKTPPEVLTQLSGWFSTALKAPEMAPKLDAQGLFPVGACGPPFGVFLTKIVDDYKRIAAEANIKAE